MTCTHPIEKLVGNRGGILCTECGKQFATYDELLADAKGESLKDPAEKPKRTRKKTTVK